MRPNPGEDARTRGVPDEPKRAEPPRAGLGSGVVSESFSLLRRFLRRGFVYSVGVEVVLAVALFPLSTWLFYRSVELLGDPVSTNYDLKSLVLNPQLLIALAWTPFLAWTVVLSIGGLVLLAISAHRGERLSIASAVTRALRALSRVRGLAVLKATVFMFIAAPVLGAAASAVATGAFWSIPDSALFEIVPRSPALVAVIALVFVAGAVLSLWLTCRWCFVWYGVIDERLMLRDAFARSVRLGRGRRAEIARLVVLAAVGSALFLSLLAGGLGLLNGGVIRSIPPDAGASFVWIVSLLIALNVIVLSCGVVLDVLWLVSLSTVAYFRAREDAPGAPNASPPTSDHSDEDVRKRLWPFAVGLGALFLVATAMTVPDVIATLDELKRTVAITAHRGSADRTPENTLPAIRAAIEDGAQYAEIDIQQASDGGLVLMHDMTLRRTTGEAGGVWERTTEQLTALDAGAWFSDEFRGVTVPTLREAIDEIRGHAILNIEIKLHGRENDLIGALIELLDEEDFVGGCVVTSLDRAVLAEVRRRRPEIRTGLIVTASVGRLDSVDVDMLVVQPLMATPAFIARAHRLGREVHVWSLHEPRHMTTMIDRGVDGILTPMPALARDVLEARTPADDARALFVRLFGRVGIVSPSGLGP